MGKPYVGSLTTRLSNGKPNEWRHTQGRDFLLHCDHLLRQSIHGVHEQWVCTGYYICLVIFNNDTVGAHSIAKRFYVTGDLTFSVAYKTRQACQDLDWDNQTLWYHCQLQRGNSCGSITRLAKHCQIQH